MNCEVKTKADIRRIVVREIADFCRISEDQVTDDLDVSAVWVDGLDIPLIMKIGRTFQIDLQEGRLTVGMIVKAFENGY